MRPGASTHHPEDELMTGVISINAGGLSRRAGGRQGANWEGMRLAALSCVLQQPFNLVGSQVELGIQVNWVNPRVEVYFNINAAGF